MMNIFTSQRRRKRTTTIAAMASTAVVAAGLGVVVSAGASPASAAMPANCNTSFVGVTSAGAIVKRKYQDGVLEVHTLNPGRLGFVPRGMVGTGAGGYDFIGEGYLANSPGGTMYTVGVSAKTSYNDVVITKTAVNPTWGSIKSLTWGAGGLYGLTDSGAFYRYQTDGGAPHTRVTIGTSGWTLNTITWDRTGVVPGTTRKADIFVATSKAGALIEYTIPLDNPAQWSSKILKASTWGNFKALVTATCYNPSTGQATSGRALYGVLTNGDVYAYYDKNATDGSGADLGGYGKIASGWTEKIYS